MLLERERNPKYHYMAPCGHQMMEPIGVGAQSRQSAKLFLQPSSWAFHPFTSDLIQNKLKLESLGTDWIEQRFGLVFAKTIIFTPKTGSINSGTGLVIRIRCLALLINSINFCEIFAKGLIYLRLISNL